MPSTPAAPAARRILTSLKQPRTEARSDLGIAGQKGLDYVVRTGAAVAGGMPRYENYPAELNRKITVAPVGRGMMRNDSLTWDELHELRRRWPTQNAMPSNSNWL